MILLLSEEIQKDQELLTRVKNEAAKIGLRLNDRENRSDGIQYSNTQPSENNWWQSHQDSGEFQIPRIIWMISSEQDIKVRKALAWDACHKLSRV